MLPSKVTGHQALVTRPWSFFSVPPPPPPTPQFICSLSMHPKRVLHPSKVTSLSEDCQTYQSTFQCVINIQGPSPPFGDLN